MVRVYVEAQTDARARLEQLMRLAALEETRLGDTEAARATTALAIRDALAEPELAALLDAYERLAGPGSGSARSRRCIARSARTCSTRR